MVAEDRRTVEIAGGLSEDATVSSTSQSYQIKDNVCHSAHHVTGTPKRATWPIPILSTSSIASKIMAPQIHLQVLR